MNEQNPPAFDAAEFDEWAASYDTDIKDESTFPFEGFSAVLDEIVQKANAQLGMRVLDLGTGTGELAARFERLGCAVTGTDFSSGMLNIARRKYPRITFQFQDLRSGWPESLPERFDRIVSAYVFHHFPLEQKVSILRELAAHLNPDGRIVIGDLSFETAQHLEEASRHYGNAWDDELYWVQADALPALEQAGFQAACRQVSNCAGVYAISPLK